MILLNKCENTWNLRHKTRNKSERRRLPGCSILDKLFAHQPVKKQSEIVKKQNDFWGVVFTYVPARNCKTVQIDADVARRSLAAVETIVRAHNFVASKRTWKIWKKYEVSCPCKSVQLSTNKFTCVKHRVVVVPTRIAVVDPKKTNYLTLYFMVNALAMHGPAISLTLLSAELKICQY